jgi:HSP20 family protein
MSLTAATEQPFGKLARQTNKLMDQLQKGYYNFYAGEAWTPNVNLYETESAYLVCVDLAGVDKTKIDIEVDNARLKIKGSRSVPLHDSASDAEAGREGDASSRKIRVHLMEIDHGAFAREVELPQGVPQERITAAYRNGMLWIEIPKT